MDLFEASRRFARSRAGLSVLALAALAAVLLAAVGAFSGARRAPRGRDQAGVRAVTDRGPRVFDVRGYGALGNGRHNDTPAINRAIAAANRAGGGVVELTRGHYLAGGSIHMRSDVTLRLDAGSVLVAAESGYDAPEPNPYARYQDAGHNHFHDAMIWGEDLHDIAFVGSGTIDGDGHLFTGNLIPGHADKIISLVRCRGLTISGITLERGGHFAILINDCHDVRSDHLTILTASDRDGWNVINSTGVRITDLIDHAYDDALAFKSDWALGATLPSGNVVVTGARLSSVCCNALMFGSETCGSFTHYRFTDIDITGAGKSGLGMVSMDGGHISDVEYSNVAMSGVAGPIMEKIGTRRSCGGHPGIGAISDIRYQNVTGTSVGTYSPTLWGVPGHRITDVSFDRVELTFPGRHRAVSLATPSNVSDLYNPDSIGPRPAYGFYLHEVTGVSFRDSTFRLRAPDARPPLVISDASAVALDHVTAAAGAGTGADVVLQRVVGFDAIDARNQAGQPLRLRGR